MKDHFQNMYRYSNSKVLKKIQSCHLFIASAMFSCLIFDLVASMHLDMQYQIWHIFIYTVYIYFFTFFISILSGKVVLRVCPSSLMNYLKKENPMALQYSVYAKKFLKG